MVLYSTLHLHMQVWSRRHICASDFSNSHNIMITSDALNALVLNWTNHKFFLNLSHYFKATMKRSGNISFVFFFQIWLQFNEHVCSFSIVNCKRRLFRIVWRSACLRISCWSLCSFLLKNANRYMVLYQFFLKWKKKFKILNELWLCFSERQCVGHL